MSMAASELFDPPSSPDPIPVEDDTPPTRCGPTGCPLPSDPDATDPAEVCGPAGCDLKPPKYRADRAWAFAAALSRLGAEPLNPEAEAMLRRVSAEGIP